MHANSSPVISNQAGLHERLDEVVRKHAASAFQRPIAEHAVAAWQVLEQRWDRSQPLVLDSGCGTARSTLMLAEQHTDSLVVGVDRSVARLEKRAELPENALLLRTNLEDFWRLLAMNKVRLAAHYLFYPNPYPKAAQLRYRWHGSPVFSVMMGLAGQVTLRSNWEVYLKEFERAAAITGWRYESAGVTVLPHQQRPITAFEEKYQASSQALFQLVLSKVQPDASGNE